MKPVLTLTLIAPLPPNTHKPVVREVRSDRFLIGRGKDCDWPLHSKTRAISREHCVIQCQNGAYSITDLSSNGLFVNGASTRLGKGRSHRLADGDRLRLGDYTISVSVEDSVDRTVRFNAQDFLKNLREQESGKTPQEPDKPLKIEESPGTLDFDGNQDPPPPTETKPQPGKPHRHPPAEQESPGTLDRHEDARPTLLVAPEPPEKQQTTEKNASAAGGDDLDSLINAALAGETPSSPPDQSGSPATTDDPLISLLQDLSDEGESDSSPGRSFQTETIEPVDQSEPSPGIFEPTPPDQPTTRPPEPSTEAPTIETEPREKPRATAHPVEANRLLAAFLEGAGASEVRVDPASAEAVMRRLGEAFQIIVGSLKIMLNARKTMRRDIGVSEQTSFGIDIKNNPLKFPPPGQGKLFHELLNGKNTVYLPMVEAFADAFKDLNNHQVNSLLGLEAAIFGLLDKLSPEAVEQYLQKHSEDSSDSLLKNLVGGNRNQRLWKAYLELYSEIRKTAEGDDALELIRDDFLSAYNQVLDNPEAEDD